MYKAIQTYVRVISHINRWVGIFAMYLVLVMMGVLLYSSFSKITGTSPLWVVELAQFIMAAYYLLGGGYSIQLDSHVRMDVFYSHWSPHRQAVVDAFTIFCLIFYLIMLLYGGISSSLYALEYDQKNYSAWAPPMAPIKIIMSLGIFLMLLQVIASFFQNVATALGHPIETPNLPKEDAV